MFWTLIIVTMMHSTAPPYGKYGKYVIVSQHEDRLECEDALTALVEKRPPLNKNQKATCIKTD